jgi:type I restriction enzyme, R subunit
VTRGRAKRADYILYYKPNIPLAVIEAKDNHCSVGDGMQQGTGKTYTAFQVIWRLWKAGRKKRILFLADRNVLIDRTMVNDFRPFGAAMAKLSTSSRVIERDDGAGVSCRSRSTGSGGSRRPMKSIWRSIKR